MENEENQSPQSKPKGSNKLKMMIIFVVIVVGILIFARSQVENALNAIALEAVKKTLEGLPFLGD